MNFLLAVITLFSIGLGLSSAQQGEKGNSIIPFPRVGRSGNSLIPFPRIGRDGGGFHEVKRQLIPFPRVGKRFFRVPVEAEYEDLIDPPPSSLFDGEEDEKRSGTPSSGGLWFGPRLGRKKRSVSPSEEVKDNLDIKPLLKMLHNSNWALLVPVKERKNFTPRLGKRAQPFSPRLGRSGYRGPPQDDEEDDDERMRFQVQTRSPGPHSKEDTTPEPMYDRAPFNPRLGRDPFSPRLGRADPFSPRLGRADPFSPRLGRSSPEEIRD